MPAPDTVGRKGVRFLLQESTGFSIPADSKGGQFKVSHPCKGKSQASCGFQDGQAWHWAFSVEEIEQPKSCDFHLPI